MPDIIVHTKFGDQICESLRLDVNRDVYNFGLLGPDPFLFYKFFVPPFRHRVNKYSSIMHREHTGDFLTELAIRAKGNRDVYSYLAGFLCHYALDSNTHPYINKLANYDIAWHLAIEHKLDRMNGDTIRIPPFLPESMREDVGGAITKIYGWEDAWEKMREGSLHQRPFYRLISDENGSFDRFAKLTHTRLKLLSYKSDAADRIDLSGFQPLYEKALEDAKRYILTAKSFVEGYLKESVFRAVIGNRSYIEG